MAVPAQLFQANQIIPGDVLETDRLIVLATEPKQVDNRIRLILLMEDGTRINRTYSPYSHLSVLPLGAARVVQESAVLRAALGNLLDVRA